MVSDPEFWRGKRVLITGHTGFKGAWLSLWLQHWGALVTGFALAPATEPCLYDVAGVAGGMTSVIGDVRDRKALAEVLANARPELVFHLAAQALVRDSYLEPVETYDTNVMGTVNLLDALRRAHDVRAAVFVTSDKCYDNKEWPWGYRENEPMGGHDPYSSSKGCAELVVAAFRDSFFAASSNTSHPVAIASARAGNVIGGGDWSKDRLVPDILRAFVGNMPLTIRHPEAVRPWQHVLEPLGGYLMLAERLYQHGAAYAEAWNFGPADADARNVGTIVSSLASLWHAGTEVRIEHAPQPHEAHTLKLDCAKARARLNWIPRWDLEAALSRIVFWHQAHLAARDMRAFSLAQIQEFSS